MKKIFLFTSLIFLAFSYKGLAQPINLSSSNVTTSTVDLSWDDTPCFAAGYTSVTLRYRILGASAWQTATTSAGASYTLTGLSANTDYEWRVKCSGCSGSGCWAPTEFFTTTGPTITSAFVTQPILCNGGYALDEMQVNINQTTPPTTYKCIIGYYATAAYFVSYENTAQTTSTTLNITGFLPDVAYFVRILDSTAYYNANGGSSGSSTVGVYDEFGPVVFSQPPPLTATTTPVASNLCTGDCIAEEDLIISGGTMPYSFDITTVSTGTTITQNLVSGDSVFSFVQLCADDYNILVTDGNGCSTSPTITSFTIAPISPIIPGATLSQPNLNYEISCFGASDGMITASATGGTGVFTYSLDGINFQSDPVFSGLSAGTYTLTYKDANGCIATESLTLNEPPDLLGTASVTQNVACFGINTGEITFVVDPANPGEPFTSGSFPYDYSIDNGVSYQSSNVFVSLAGDSTYDVMIQDANQCQFSVSVYVAEPPAMTFTTTLSNHNGNGFEVSCNGASDGEINTTATGGTGLISYSIDGFNFQNTGLFPNLSAGTYTVGYQDDNGCIQTDVVTLNEPGVFTISYTTNNSIDCATDCDGAISINPNNAVGQVLYSLDAGTQQTTPFFSGLCGDITYGTYILDAVDNNGCLATDIVSIPEPTSISYTSSSLPESCSPPNGEINTSATGGTGSINYSIDGITFQSSGIFSNLLAGTYTLTYEDANGCVETAQETVSFSPAFSISFTTVSPCLGPLSGSATVSATGATGGLSYQWSDNTGIMPGEISATLNNVPVGTYTVDVTDGTSCTISGSVDIIPPINPIQFDSLIITNNSCYGIDDAQIEIIASGGAQPYLYSSDGGISTQNNPVFGLLSPGFYPITAIDLNGCYIVDTVQIVYPGLLEIDSTHFTNVSCNGANDAEILAIDVSGGTAPFAYSVNGSTHYSNMSYFNGYAPGTYTVEVYDVNNCVAADYIIITEPDELIVDITTSGWVFNNNSGLYSYQIKCNGDNSGFANLSISGGTAPYTETLLDAIGTVIPATSFNSFTGLSAGQYDFEVVDANGCAYLETIVFNQPPPITHNFIPTHVTCTDWSNGSLTDVVSGGVGNATSYLYSWNTGDTTYTLNGIPVGTYTMTVQDENNCTSVASYTINDNDALSVTSSHLDITCFDYCDGWIQALPSGGLPNYDLAGAPVYMYQWNDILLQTTQTAIGLCADNNSNTTEYSCIITDSQGCSDTIYASLTQPDSLFVSATVTSDYNFQDISCYGADDGKLQASTIGGQPPYIYAWNTSPIQTSPNATGLSAGEYTVVVTDQQGCADTTAITLIEPTELTISVTQTNINCFEIYDGSITADADGGTPFNGIPPMYNYSFSSGFNEQIDVSTDINLEPGLYTVTATDQNGCSVVSESIFISQPTDILSLDLDSIDESCNASNGVVNSFVAGGSPPYNYIWSNGVNNVSSINNLSPDIYFVEVEDANGCIVYDTIRVNGTLEVFLPGNISSFDTIICLGETFALNIQEQIGLKYIWEHENVVLLNRTIGNLANDHADIIVYPDDSLNIYTLTIIDSSCPGSDTLYQVFAEVNIDFIDPMPKSNPDVEYGNYPIVLAGDNIELYSENNNCISYTWMWSNDTISNNNGSIFVNELESSETYYLYVEDNNGCLGFDSIYVVVGVLPYEAITPNGDGFNDTWTPRDITEYKDALVQVFNRWGGLVFESKGGESYTPWAPEEGLAVGTYYYVIDLNTGDDPQTGPITLIR